MTNITLVLGLMLYLPLDHAVYIQHDQELCDIHEYAFI